MLSWLLASQASASNEKDGIEHSRMLTCTGLRIIAQMQIKLLRHFMVIEKSQLVGVCAFLSLPRNVSTVDFTAMHIVKSAAILDQT